MKLGYKLGIIFLIYTLVVSLLFYFVGLQSQKNAFQEIAKEHLKSVRDSFFILEERDTKLLFSALEAIVRDPAIKARYLKKDRDRLYSYVEPLFRNLYARYGVTHFYFILPDGHVFLRMHDKGLYGDLVKRISFMKARDTQAPAWEMELGKTAFALRAVMPYYEDGKLIGYLELAEGVNHFLTILKNQTNSEFAIVGEKEYLDRGDWKSVREVAGLRDNWGDMNKHVLLGSTNEEKMPAKFLNEGILTRVEKKEDCFEELRIRDQTFVGCGFALTDTRGIHTGAVLPLIDITNHVAIAERANRTMERIAIVLFAVTFTAGVLVSRFITKPILRLTDVAREVERGNLDQRVSARSSDEIGELGRTFNEMIEHRKETESALKGSLKEKEILLRELYHRTKNNMQVISSLISLQSASVTDQKTLNMLNDMKGRIRAMSLVHEKLYQSGDLSNVEIRDYVADLAHSMLETYKGTAPNVSLALKLESLSCPLEKAVPYGILIHELISNSLKHAFPDNRKGEIRIALSQTEKTIDLDFSDNGVGFPAGFDIKNANTLGLKLIYNLVEKQLRGKVEYHNDNGASFHISFEKC